MSGVFHGRVALRDNYEPAALFVDEHHVADYDIDGSDAMLETANHLDWLSAYMVPDVRDSVRAVAVELRAWADRLVKEQA